MVSRFRSASRLLLGTGAAILALCWLPPIFAQARSSTENPQQVVTVPFVGCESHGQTERLEPPKGTSRTVATSPKDAQMLAYYKSGDRIGLLAPRGWNCEGASGSSGAVLFLSPKPIESSPSGWKGLEGPAIEVYHMDGGTSGRYGVAEIIARVFPAYRAIAKPILEGLDIRIPSGPFPKDRLTYKSSKIVEYVTPAQTEGLGTSQTWLKKSDLPIAGVAILISDPRETRTNSDALTVDIPDMLLLSMRFPPDLARLTPMIVDYLERETMGGSRK